MRGDRMQVLAGEKPVSGTTDGNVHAMDVRVVSGLSNVYINNLEVAVELDAENDSVSVPGVATEATLANLATELTANTIANIDFALESTQLDVANSVANVDAKLYEIAPSSPNAAWGANGTRVLIGPTDIISNMPVVIDYDHHQLHEGEIFRWSVYVSSLASGSSKDIQLVVPNIAIPAGIATVERCPHLRFEVVGDALTDIFLYEGTTFTAPGTQRTPVAMERNGSYTSKLEIYEDPSVNVAGTQLFRGVLFTTKNNSGVLDKSIDEFVLKNDTSYLFRVTSGANGAKVLIRLVWYEDLGI